MNVRRETQYKIAHKVAKAIVCSIVIALMVVARTYELTFLDIVAVLVWFFGTNPIAYFIETSLNFEHKHEKL